MYVLYFVLLIDISVNIYADIYAATTEIEYLVMTRMKLIEDLHLYIEEEEKNLSTIKRYYKQYKRENKEARSNISNYISNPINAFIIIKSLTTDLNDIEYLMTKETGKTEKLKHKNLVYPSYKDLKGAAQGLSRLIQTYHLNVRDLAEGILNGEVTSSPMSASDCYTLGETLFKAKEFEMSIQWMLEAYRKYNDNNINHRFTDIDILIYISSGFNKIGDISSSIQWTRKILNIEPNNKQAKRNLSAFRERNMDEIINMYKHDGIVDIEGSFNVQESNAQISWDSYEQLCRGELDVSIHVLSRLTCRYLTENHPFLKIAPVKMEIKYLDPEVALFYEVFNDREMDIVKRIALPELGRAEVAATGRRVVTESRVGKTSWFFDSHNDVLQRISHRLEHITGLSMKHSNHMQICNYGIGGQYEPHVDPFFKNDTRPTHKGLLGRRIATVMLYLSDVSQGGATVFPILGVKVAPVRGTALVWYNLHASGELNEATLHAACPVLEGSKWVCTKWIYQAGQELLKPCNLQYQREEDLITVPSPVLKISRDRRLFEENKRLPEEQNGQSKNSRI